MVLQCPLKSMKVTVMIIVWCDHCCMCMPYYSGCIYFLLQATLRVCTSFISFTWTNAWLVYYHAVKYVKDDGSKEELTWQQVYEWVGGTEDAFYPEDQSYEVVELKCGMPFLCVAIEYMYHQVCRVMHVVVCNCDKCVNITPAIFAHSFASRTYTYSSVIPKRPAGFQYRFSFDVGIGECKCFHVTAGCAQSVLSIIP